MTFFLIAIIIALAQIVQTISGFGSTLISVTIAISFMELDALLPILLPLNLLQSSYIVLRYRNFIFWKLLLKKIIPLMFLGIILGFYFKNIFSGSVLKQVFGIFISLMAVLEIYKIKYSTKNTVKTSKPKGFLLLFSSGFIHGIYACGGPPLVYYLSGLQMDRQYLRSTLASIWVLSNTFLIGMYWQDNAFNSQNLLWIFYLLPVVFISIWIGDKLHHYISEDKFRFFLYCILFFAGVSLFFS